MTAPDPFVRSIAASGPIPVAQFVAESNARYYASRDPLGPGGDFVTAPEVSQMFGELIGVWLADLWLRAAKPEPVRYVELGPGRGTLARDACRAAARFGLAPQVHFVEASEALRGAQRERHPAARWHDSLASLPDDGALLIVANEFFDALPLRQLVRTPQGWRERMVGVEAGKLAFVAGTVPMDAALPPERREAPIGAIVETCPAAAAIMAEIARRLARQGGAALIVDYGYAEPRPGSTLQAVRGHRRLDPLEAAGTADLSAHVNFAALAQVAAAHGARPLGPVGQGAFLGAMGIEARAAALTAAAPDQAEAIAAALERLTAEAQMGTLFKVLGLVAPGWPDAAAF